MKLESNHQGRCVEEQRRSKTRRNILAHLFHSSGIPWYRQLVRHSRHPRTCYLIPSVISPTVNLRSYNKLILYPKANTLFSWMNFGPNHLQHRGATIHLSYERMLRDMSQPSSSGGYSNPRYWRRKEKHAGGKTEVRGARR